MKWFSRTALLLFFLFQDAHVEAAATREVLESRGKKGSKKLKPRKVSLSFTVEQEPPLALEIVDFGKPGQPPANVLAFDSVVKVEELGLTGELSGLITTVDLAEEDEVFLDRIVNIVFDFDEVGQIVVGGKTRYPNRPADEDDVEIVIDVPQTRAIVGGTLDFIGASGQVTTTRNSDGSYTHLVELI